MLPYFLSVVLDCIHKPDWPWWTLFLVPIYLTCSSLSNLQYWRSLQLLVMVLFSCCAFTANHAASLVLPGRTDIVSVAGAFVIGLLGNLYSHVVGGTAFTSMVTGILLLVLVRPRSCHCCTCVLLSSQSGIAQGGG